MKVAIINEVSAKEKNNDILEALQKYDLEIHNVGMVNGDNDVEFTYIHTGLMAGILLNLGSVDLVVGGCGTGQGFMLSSMQYPKVFCGLVIDPLDAWLFSQINGGNCVALALNKGYGWAGNFNIEYIFEKLFKDPFGTGYPPARQVSQRESREKLAKISQITHKSMQDILKQTDSNILDSIFSHKPFVELVKTKALNTELQNFILKHYIGAK